MAQRGDIPRGLGRIDDEHALCCRAGFLIITVGAPDFRSIVHRRVHGALESAPREPNAPDSRVRATRARSARGTGLALGQGLAAIAIGDPADGARTGRSRS